MIRRAQENAFVYEAAAWVSSERRTRQAGLLLRCEGAGLQLMVTDHGSKTFAIYRRIAGRPTRCTATGARAAARAPAHSATVRARVGGNGGGHGRICSQQVSIL
jgi:hypothetical protein